MSISNHLSSNFQVFTVSSFSFPTGNEFDQCPVKSRGAGVLKTHAQRCYQFINYEMFWQDARNYCLHRGGDLITIHRPDIQQFVVRSLKELGWRRNGVWIGATDKHDEEDWRWVTGTVRPGFFY